jgi:hypothetical protein
MTIFKIPRVAVYIPGETTRIKFVPEYDFPIFKRIFNGRVADVAGDPLRIIPHPKDCQTYAHYWLEVEAEDEAGVVQAESARLRAEYGTPQGWNDTVFDTVYVGDTFENAVAKALTSAGNHEADAKRADPADKILALCAPLRIDRRTARKLCDIGWYDLDQMAGADPVQLAKVVGRVSAAKLIEAANAAIGNLINATPAEQIAAAKGSKSK